MSFRVTIEATFDIDLNNLDADYLAELRGCYIPTYEESEADDEWLAEEVALRRISDQGLEQATITDVTEITPGHLTIGWAIARRLKGEDA